MTTGPTVVLPVAGSILAMLRVASSESGMYPFTAATVCPSRAGSLQSTSPPAPMANVWGSTGAETQVGVLAEAVAAVSPLRRSCPWTTAIWLNRSARGKVTVLVEALGVEMAVVGFFVVGEG